MGKAPDRLGYADLGAFLDVRLSSCETNQWERIADLCEKAHEAMTPEYLEVPKASLTHSDALYPDEPVVQLHRSSQHRLSPAQEREICQRYQSDELVNSIGESFGISRKSVWWVAVKKYGLQPRVRIQQMPR